MAEFMFLGLKGIIQVPRNPSGAALGRQIEDAEAAIAKAIRGLGYHVAMLDLDSETVLEVGGHA